LLHANIERNITAYPHWLQIEAAGLNSRLARQSGNPLWLSANGQISVVLPEKIESNPVPKKLQSQSCARAGKPNHRFAGNIRLEAHTASALDAAFAIKINQLSK